VLLLTYILSLCVLAHAFVCCGRRADVPAVVHHSSSSSDSAESQYSLQPTELLLSDVVQVHRIEAIAGAARVGLVKDCGGLSDVDEVSAHFKY
jgi:hypothetical protein